MVAESIRAYVDRQGAPYKEPPSRGFCVMRVLEFLNGKRLDEITFNWIAALRPTTVRVRRINHEVTCDAWHWRVTIFTDEDDVIEYIEQEVMVGTVGVEHGADLMARTQER